MARSRKPVKNPEDTRKKRLIRSDEQRLAENLAAAAIATRLNVDVDYAKKHYMNQPVGEFWFYLARIVIDSMFGEKAAEPPQGSPTLQ